MNTTNLSWEPRDGDKDTLRGYLTTHPETTLFFIERDECRQGCCEDWKLSGALIPDDEEQERWDVKNAKAAAEQYLYEWLRDVAAPLLANNDIPTERAE